MKSVSAAEMREIDRRATASFGIPGIVLMENAGRAVADAAETYLRAAPGKGAAIFCGRGNNGGDGLVAARSLFNRGYPVEIILARPPESFTGDARTNYGIVRAQGIPVAAFDPARAFDTFAVVIDALLGTGARSAPEGVFKDAIALINLSQRPVIAVDLPSGLDADTGDRPGETVRATFTVTMGLPKKGFLNPASASFIGKLIIAEIGLPRALLA